MPERITADAVMTDRGVDETTSLTMEYGQGHMSVMNVSMKYMNRRKGTICGTKGYAEVDDVNCLKSLKVYNEHSELIAEYTNPKVSNGYLFELDSTVKAMCEGRTDTPECPHHEILQRMAVLDEIRRNTGLRYPFEQDE